MTEEKSLTPPALRATSPREAWGGAHELLVRIDQKLLASRALVVDRDVLEIEHLRQRDHLRVVARKGRLQALDHTLAQPHLLRPADLLQERRQQPAADAPRHAVVAYEFDRSGVEAAIDIDLLVRGRAIAAVDLGGLVERDFHAGQDLA